MLALFPACAALFGERAGYNIAFALHWALGIGISTLWLGPARIRELMRFRALPKPRWISLGLLVMPPLGGAIIAFIPQLGHSDALVVGVAAGRALLNATSEELLWRGAAVAKLSGRGWEGWLCPSLLFVAFHAAPLLVHGGLAAAPGILVGAAWIGLGFGWIAGRSGSIGWPLVAHLATDAMGLSAARYALGVQ
jgi:membrane protease YdiL (CAAX protease family)